MRKIIFLPLIFMAFLIPVAHATEPVDLNALPQNLADALNIPLFAGQILASCLFISLFTFPAMMLAGRDNALYAILVVGLPVMGFCTALEWLPYWFLLIVCLIVALLFSGQIRGWLSRGGTE